MALQLIKQSSVQAPRIYACTVYRIELNTHPEVQYLSMKILRLEDSNANGPDLEVQQMEGII